MGKELAEKFISSKELRNEFIKAVTVQINKSFKDLGINKEYKVEDLIARANDPKRQEIYLKCNEYSDDTKTKTDMVKNYAKQENVHLNPGYARSIYSFLKVPSNKFHDPINDKIRQDNIEIIKKYSDKNLDIRETIKKDFKDILEMDKSILYPKNIEEALDNIEKYEDKLEIAHCIDSIFGNSGFAPNNQELQTYNYYKTTLEDGSINDSFIRYNASTLALFLPEDIESEVLFFVMNQMRGLKSYDSIMNLDKDLNDAFSYKAIIDEKKEFNAKLRNFFDTHDKDFMLKHTIGGDNFKVEFNKNINNIDNIQLEDADSSLKYGLIMPDYGNAARDFRTVNDTINPKENDISNNKININDLTKDFFEKNNLSELDINFLSRYYLVAKLNTHSNPSCNEFINKVDALIENGTINKAKFDNYVKAHNQGIAYRVIDKVDEKGIHFVNLPDKKFDDPNMDFVYKLMQLNLEHDKNHFEYKDNHFDKERVTAIEKSADLYVTKEYALNYLIKEYGLKQNAFIEDVVNAVLSSDKKLPEGLFEQIAKEGKESKFTIIFEKDFNKFQDAHQDLDLSDIKKALRNTSHDFSAEFESIEKPFERGTTIYALQDPAKEFIKNNPEMASSIKISTEIASLKLKVNEANNKKILDHKLIISDKTKENIKKVINKMIELGIYDKNDIDPELKERGEQSFKIYGLQKLKTKRLELVNAIKENNVDLAHQKAKEVEKTIDKYKELYKFVEKTLPQDGKHVPGNLGVFRNNDHPLDVQLNYQAQSQVNGLYNMLVFCENQGIDPYDLIDKPHEYMDRFIGAKKYDLMYYFDVDQKAKNKEERNISMGRALSRLIQTSPTIKGHIAIGRAFESITVLEEDQKNVENNAMAQLYSNAAINNPFDYGSNFFETKDPIDNANQIYINYEQTRDYMALGHKYSITNFMTDSIDVTKGEFYKKEYNYEEFVKNDPRSLHEIYEDTMNKITYAIEELNKGDTDNLDFNMNKNMSAFMCGAMAYFNDVLKEKNPDFTKDLDALKMKKFLDYPVRTVCEEMKTKFNRDYNKDTLTVDYYTGIDDFGTHEDNLYEKQLMEHYKTIDGSSFNVNDKINDYQANDSYYATEKWDNDLKNKNFKEVTNESLSLAFAMKKRNESRTIFGQIFKPSAWKERRILKEIKAKALANGIREQDYNIIMRAADTDNNRNAIANKIVDISNNTLETKILEERNIANINIDPNQREQIEVTSEDLEQDKNRQSIRGEIDMNLDISNEIDESLEEEKEIDNSMK